MTVKHQPATPLQHKYGAGTRLSSAYTAGANGQAHAKHYGGMRSAATKAWLAGRKERDAAYEAEKQRRASAYPKLVKALRKVLELAAVQRGMLRFDKTPTEIDAAALLTHLGEAS